MRNVYATLGLPMGEFEVIEGQTSDADIQFLDLWRRRWHVERGGPPIGSMDEILLSRGGHGHDFVTDFITICNHYLHCRKCKWHLSLPGSQIFAQD